MSNQAEFLKRLNYKFKDETLLQTALTHASAGGADYERLEFLGDRVLGLVVAEQLYALYPNEREGDLSKRHTALVRAETLARAARTLDIGTAMTISESERAGGGSDNENILSDIMEAVIGAVFLDGGMAEVQKILKPLLADDLNNMAGPPRDPKTALQEWAQARGLGLPEYVTTERKGPDHAPDFTITVTLPGHQPATGKGSSKRAAEKDAAQNLLMIVEKKK